MIITWDDWITASGGTEAGIMNEIEALLATVSRYYWEPKADITTHELALNAPMIGMETWVGKINPLDFLDDWYDALPPKAQRHWRVEPPSAPLAADETSPVD